MTTTIAFDVYGTLIDTQGVTTQLEHYLGDLAKPFAEKWRDKQLEYSFRRGLMAQYRPFSLCIANALDYCCQYYNVDLTEQQKQTLLKCYTTLPAFDDVIPGLTALSQSPTQRFAFSNGTADAVSQLLKHAAIDQFFNGLVSVDDINTFKPNPDVYHYFLQRSGTPAEHCWLVSSNPFDIIGASHCGFKTAWIKRTEQALFDPWGIEPTVTVDSLVTLATVIDAN